MFVRTRDGRWLNEAGSVILPDSNGGCWFEAMSPTDHFNETADELAALFNGAAQQQPRMVELQATSTGKEPSPVLVNATDVSSVAAGGKYPGGIVDSSYVTLKSRSPLDDGANIEYHVVGSYAETKRLLFGDGPTDKDGE
jgi:hypothetical protein